MKHQSTPPLTTPLPGDVSHAGTSRFGGWRSKFLAAGLCASAIILCAPPAAEAALIQAGNDLINNSTGRIDLTIFPAFFPGGFTETISLAQTAPPAIIHRDAQVGSTIDTEIVSLQLSGVSTNVGPVTARVGTAQGVLEGGSFGQIINVVQNPLDPGFPTGAPSSFASGDSFFDVFFEIDFSGGILYNKVPHNLGPQHITELPPFATYASPQVHQLWMDVGVIGNHGDDIQVGLVGPLIHSVPEPSTFGVLAGLVLMGISAGGRLRRRNRETV